MDMAEDMIKYVIRTVLATLPPGDGFLQLLCR